MAENYKHLYEQTKKMLTMYQDELIPGFRKKVEELEAKVATDNNVGSKWIPVTERLPEKDDRYATVCNFGNGAVSRGVLGFAKDFSKVVSYKTTAENVWYEYDREYGFVMITYVTHWMPLPEPPKEVK